MLVGWYANGTNERMEEVMLTNDAAAQRSPAAAAAADNTCCCNEIESGASEAEAERREAAFSFSPPGSAQTW